MPAHGELGAVVDWRLRGDFAVDDLAIVGHLIPAHEINHDVAGWLINPFTTAQHDNRPYLTRCGWTARSGHRECAVWQSRIFRVGAEFELGGDLAALTCAGVFDSEP